MDTVAIPVIALVLPCYNEEQILPLTAERLAEEVQRLVDNGQISAQSKIVFVDDGSTDGTWSLIEKLAAGNHVFKGIKLARNYGHQYALYAGLMETEADALVSLDADLQDDVAAIEKMVVSFRAGNEIVYGVRNSRENDTSFKRTTAAVHYWLLSKLGIEVVPNHADFRLMSRRAVSFLSEYREANLYLRGIIPLLGLRSDKVYYSRGARLAGESKYPFLKMLSLSLQGLTSFSIVPVRIFSILGVLVFIAALFLGGWALMAVLLDLGTVPGWASTVIPIYLLGGLQLLAIGVTGEYVGKTFIESKGRPLYQVEQRSGVNDAD